MADLSNLQALVNNLVNGTEVSGVGGEELALGIMLVFAGVSTANFRIEIQLV